VIFLGMLAGLAVLAIPVVIVILVVDTRALRRRVLALEQAVAAIAIAHGSAPEARGDAAGAPRPAVEAAPEAPKEPPVEPPIKPPVEPAGVEPPPAAPTAPEAAPPSAAPRAPGPLGRAGAWLAANWFYAVSAVSLGLAGVFLLQYGIETGLLTPPMRVLAALALGAALIAAGEVIRRRSGDTEDSATAFLPSTFSAAGIVVLYAAVLAARALYGLIGAEVTFAALVAVSATALVFGWFYGPFLAAAGLSGAAAAPFLVGGSAESALPFYLYYALLGAVGLAIDALRRWGWVSVLALGLAYTLGATVLFQGGEVEGFVGLLLWLALAAVALPRLEPVPRHPGWTIAESLRRAPLPGETGVIAPTRIAAGAVAATAALLLPVALASAPAEAMLALVALAALALALILWTAEARGLADLWALPAAAILGLLPALAILGAPLFREFAGFDVTNPELVPPRSVTVLLALAGAVSAAAAWRSAAGPWPVLWSAAAATVATSAAVAFEVFWAPAAILGAWPWAGHVIALAALMTLFAERFGRADGPGSRAAYPALAALTLIALALFILLSEAALTVALAVLVVAAAALDRRFGLSQMRWFHLAAVATLGWRLILDPGLAAYLEDAPLAEVLLAFGAALAGLAAAGALLPAGRAPTRALLESALWAYGGVFATVLLWRAILALRPAGEVQTVTHWSAALLGLTWAALALAQLFRLRRAPELRALRVALALGYGVLALAAFGLSLGPLNPVFGFGGRILGMQPADTLSVGYALPGLAAATLAARARWLPRRRLAGWAAGLFLAVWAFLEIRWFWQGDGIASGRFSQPEITSYTGALLLTGAGLLSQALARRSVGLRRLAVAVIAVTVAKVFLIDAAGLSGLLRVFSFLALGLALAGLAWLNRWAAGREGAPPGDRGSG
jgi:uncharacterized membrane protein